MNVLRIFRDFVIPAVVISLIGLSFFGTTPSFGAERKSDTPLSGSTELGQFTLVDHTGRQVSQEDFLGNYLLIYFGFTHCPDVCPTGLHILTNAVELLGAKGINVIPIFVTVDPERDSPQIMKTYVNYFHPRLVGLTGNTEQIDNIAKLFGARYSKVIVSTKGNMGDSNYVLQHSESTYLVNKDGRLLATITDGVTPQALAQQILPFIGK